jgi:hypothetical protein
VTAGELGALLAHIGFQISDERRALIVRAVMPSNALADLETFGLGWSYYVHCQPTV